MKWLLDVFKFLRFIDNHNRDYEKRIGLKYHAMGNERLWTNLSLLAIEYRNKHPKISQGRINKIAIHAAAHGFLDTQTNKGTMGGDEESFDVSISEAGHRFIDLDFGFIPTRLMIAWYNEDGKAVIAAYIAIIGLLAVILGLLIRVLTISL